MCGVARGVFSCLKTPNLHAVSRFSFKFHFHKDYSTQDNKMDGL